MSTATIEEQQLSAEVIRRPGYTTVQRFSDGFIAFNGRSFTAQNHFETMQYEFKKHDLVVCTYPKSGTTWAQNIVHLLLHDGDQYADSDNTMMDQFQFLEARGTKDLINSSKPIKTHYCPETLKYKADKSKWIVVMRNPKDTAVSLYFHSKSIQPYEFSNGTWDNWFKQFFTVNEKTQNYFYWTKSWLPYLTNENVCFLTYEDMAKDPEFAIRKMANHIGGKALATVGSPHALEKVVNNQKFENMKKNSDKIMHKKMDRSWDSNQSEFLRNGKVGDWRNYFTKEQSDIADEIFLEQFTGTIAENWWKDDCAL